MAKVKHFVVIGLGTFGKALATQLSKNGCRVTGVDIDKQSVEEVADELYEAIVGDATSRETVAQLPIKTADTVYIAMGEDIALSLLATLHVKSENAQRVIVKGVTREHGAILESLGADRVVFPEIEMAGALADRAVWPNVIDYLPIGADYVFIEVSVPDALAGKSLMDLRLRQRFDVWVVGVKNALTGDLDMFPDGTYVMRPDEMLLIVGHEKDVARVQDLH